VCDYAKPVPERLVRVLKDRPGDVGEAIAGGAARRALRSIASDSQKLKSRHLGIAAARTMNATRPAARDQILPASLFVGESLLELSDCHLMDGLRHIILQPVFGRRIVIWEAQAGPQTALIACPVFEVFFGGARGGGKTDGVLGDFLEHADTYGENAIGLMIRRQRTELIETIERSRAIYTPLGWTYHEQEKMWRAPNGARLRFAYLERDAMPRATRATATRGCTSRRSATSQPTSPSSSSWPRCAPALAFLLAFGRPAILVDLGINGSARYIDPAPDGLRIIKDAVSGLERVYIPSRVGDNKFLGADYVQQLKASGSKELVKAWLEGDWSVIEGAFFDCWESSKHVIRPFEIPKTGSLSKRRLGLARPFSVGWWAVVGDDYPLAIAGGAAMGRERLNWIRLSPRGAMVRYREWYGRNGPTKA
jgi:hypothetical protein